MTSPLHLVGSIPLDTVQDVFESFGARLGGQLATLPDGEVGPRNHWISRVHYQVLAGHPDFETLRRPAPDDDGVERVNPRNAGDSWLFKVRDGVDQVRFGDPGWRLGYARDALNSYFAFKLLREAGGLANHLRFQVSMPSVNSVIPYRIFPDRADADKVRPGYTDALLAELGTIVERIPAEDLAIQWDCTTEMQDAYGVLADLPADGRIERNLEQFRRLGRAIPDQVQLGFHLCFGTLGGWPRFAPEDLSGAVEMANAMISETGRRVDGIHIPVLDRADDAYFAPLTGLRPGSARVYLGVIHNMERLESRIAAARKYLPEFGVAAYCGFGREKPSEMPQVLEDHLTAAAL